MVSRGTVDKALGVLKAFFNWSIARGLAVSNPVRRVKLFHEDNSRLRYLTREEYNRLLRAAKTIRTSPYLVEKIVLRPIRACVAGAFSTCAGSRST